MKRMTIALLGLGALLAAAPLQARPGGGRSPGGGRGGHGYAPPPPPRHHGGGHTWHGRDWGAFGAGVLIGTATRAILPPPPIVRETVVVTPATTYVQPAPVVVTPAPVVVTPTPTVITQPTQVWVEGYWRVTNDANGRPISRTWVEGHWENR